MDVVSRHEGRFIPATLKGRFSELQVRLSERRENGIMTLLDDQVSSPDVAPAEVDPMVDRAASYNSPFPPPPPPVLSGPSQPRRGRLAGAVLLCAAVSAGVSYTTVKLTEDRASVSYVASSSGSSGGSATDSFDIHALLAKVQPAVAAIEIGDRVGGTVNPIAAGSGVVISTDGLMVTNAHVVEAVDSSGNPLTDMVITVKMADGTVRSARVLGSSTAYDVALLQLDDTKNLHPLTLADATKFQVGDRVVAIGNALDLGDSPTVTTGIISALDRTLQENPTVTLRGLIQTDAAINHGNSGGALVNSAGELVGINSAGIPDAQNIGFAISVGTIQQLLPDLREGKQISAAPIGYIGVTLSETPNGITVATVQPSTPAATAGIQPGDVITKVNETAVSTANQLSVVLRSLAPGTKVTLTVTRAGAEKLFTLTLAQRPAN
jgi:putative serine protease PepD